MPQRTNDFQKLIALIERALAPQGAKVTESAMVSTDGPMREVDVLIEAMAGPYKMKIAVEAKDEKRPMDLTKYEAIKGKYSGNSGIRVNQVVVIARSGFTKEVLIAAPNEGILLLTLERALAADWLAKVPQKVHLSVAPHITRIDLLLPEMDAAIKQSFIERGRFICGCCGKDHGNPLQIARGLMNNVAIMDQARERSSRANSPACFPVTRRFGHRVALKLGDEQHPVTQMVIHINCTESRGDLAVDAYKHGEDIVHHLHGTAGTADVQFVISDGDSTPQIAFNLQANTRQHAASITKPRVAKIPAFLREDVPENLPGIILALQAELNGTNAAIHRDAFLHNFMTGEDNRVHILFDFFLTPGFRLRTGVVFLKNSVSREETKSWAHEIATGCELDRLIVVCDKHVPRDHSNPCRHGVLYVHTNDDLKTAIFPGTFASTTRIKSMEIKFLGDEIGSVKPDKESAIELPSGKRIPILNLVNLWGGRLIDHSLRQAYFDLGTADHAAFVFDFGLETPLPQGTKVITASGSQEINNLSGNISIEAFLIKCSKGNVVNTNGEKSLELRTSDDGTGILSAASPPTPDTVRLHGTFVSLPPMLKQRQVLPREFWADLFASSPLQSASGAHQIASVQAPNEPWRIHILNRRFLNQVAGPRGR